jgi:hypothetical protein
MAPYPVDTGIDSLSHTPDTFLDVTRPVPAVERWLGRAPRDAVIAKEAA